MGLDSTHQKREERVNADSRTDDKAEFGRYTARTQTRATEADKSNVERFSSTKRSAGNITRCVREFVETTQPTVESLQDYSRRRKENDGDREKADEHRNEINAEHKKSGNFIKKIGRLEHCIDVTSSINSQIAVIADKHLREKEAHQLEQQEKQRKLQAQKLERLEPKPQAQVQLEPKVEPKVEPNRPTYRSPRP